MEKQQTNESTPDHATCTAAVVNLYTRKRLALVKLAALPAKGDWLYLGERAYQVRYRAWHINRDGTAVIQVMVDPTYDEEGERRHSYEGEAEDVYGV